MLPNFITCLDTEVIVLADSLYGESDSIFVQLLDQLLLPYVLVIRSNHAVWLPKE